MFERRRGSCTAPLIMMGLDIGEEPSATVGPDILALKHKSRILGHSSNPVCGFSMMEQVRLCAVWPLENWLGSSLNQIQGWTTVQEPYSRALEQGPLVCHCRTFFRESMQYVVLPLSVRRAPLLFSHVREEGREGST